MKKPQLILTIFLASLLLGSCRTSVNTEIDSEEQQNEEITVAPETPDSEVAETENNSINHSESSETKPDIIIEDLADGSYRFCSDVHPNEIKPDAHRWCFDFNKTDKQVIGSYLYRAPKDVPIMCLEGVIEGNKVSGVGYEKIQYGETKPDIEKEKLKIHEHTSFLSEEGYWDYFRHGGQGGNNLKVDSPHFYKLIEPEQPGYNYWAWIRYDAARLDLSNFEKIESTSFPQFETNRKCVD